MGIIHSLSDIDWFEWNGVKCTNYGMHVLQQPSYIRPAERVEYKEIPGRAGSLILLEGEDVYDDISLACTCVIDEPSVIRDICSWLRGYGKVKFATDDTGYYEARVENQISFDKIVAGNPHRSFQVQFRCKPFRRLDSGDTTITVSTSPYTLKNLGNVLSLPLLKVYAGSSDVTDATIMIGSSTMIINSLEKNSYIMIDCEAKKAYRGSRGSASDPLTLLGTRVTGEWMKIPTGTSYVSFTGGISKIEITPRWRCLG